MPEAASLRPLLSPAQAAEILGVTPADLQAFYQAGEIARINIGRGAKRGHYRYEASDIEAFIRQRRLAAAIEIPKRAAVRLEGGSEIELTLVRDFACRKGNAKQKATPDLVYFIRSGSLVKIGCSSDPQARLRQLTTGNAFGLRLAAVVAGGRKVERDLHKRFAQYRHQAEWFHCDGALAALVEDLSARFAAEDA